MRQYLCTLMLLAIWPGVQADEALYAIDEEFVTLDGWRGITFSGIERTTRYTTSRLEGRTVLVADSEASASALVTTTIFDVYRYPILTWSWKVDAVVAGGDYRTKAGDDYPIRLYVVFAYDPDRADLVQRTQYGLAKLIYGEYPPHSTLNYIWANRADAPEIIVNAYTDRARMLPMEAGSGAVGLWRHYQVDMVQDYRRAFGEDPPAMAAIAVMSDSDDTGGRARALIDFVRVGLDSTAQEQGDGQAEHGQADEAVQNLPGSGR